FKGQDHSLATTAPACWSGPRNPAATGARKNDRALLQVWLCDRYPLPRLLQVQQGREADPSEAGAARFVTLSAKTPSSAATSVWPEPERGTRRVPAANASTIRPSASCSEPGRRSVLCASTAPRSTWPGAPGSPGLVNTLSSQGVLFTNQPQPAVSALSQRAL